jgi:hypothetical protein
VEAEQRSNEYRRIDDCLLCDRALTARLSRDAQSFFLSFLNHSANLERCEIS